MDKTIGFIGCGNMGQSILKGLIESKNVSAQNVMVSDINENYLKNIRDMYEVKTFLDNKKVVEKSEVLFIAVKPNIYNKVIKEIKDTLKENTIIISIAAGKTIESVEKEFDRDIKLIRIMPNTPASVGEGMTAVCPNKNISYEELSYVLKLLQSFGKTEVIEEKLIDAFIAVSGSSPAYVFMFIEAMADAAVMGGISRDKAYKMAAQSVLGSAKMVLETEKHPGELKDMVCSPGGTTIEAVGALEESGFRASVIKAMKKCMEKSEEMSR